MKRKKSVIIQPYGKTNIILIDSKIMDLMIMNLKKGKKIDMEELKKLLENVSDTYSDFVRGVMGEARDCPEKLDELKEYIKENPDATSSDIGKWTGINMLGLDPDNPPELILTDDDEDEE